MKIISLLVLLFAYWAMMFSYYWQANQQVTLSIVVFQIIVIPTILISLLLTLSFMIKKFNKKEDDVESQPIDDVKPVSEEDSTPKKPMLKVFASSLLLPIDNSLPPEEAFSQYTSAEIPNSFEDDTASVRMRTVVDESQIEPFVHSDMQPRTIRISVMLKNLIDDLSSTLEELLKVITLAHSWNAPIQQHTATLHQSLFDSVAVADATLKVTTEDIPEEPKNAPTQLEISLFLPNDLDSVEVKKIKFLLIETLQKAGFGKDLFNLHVVLSASSDETLAELAKKIAAIDQAKKPVCQLLIGADTGIDQDWIEDESNNMPTAVSEGAGACILASVEAEFGHTTMPVCQLTTIETVLREHVVPKRGNVNANQLVEKHHDIIKQYHIDINYLQNNEAQMIISDINGFNDRQLSELNDFTRRCYPSLPSESVLQVGNVLECPQRLTPLFSMVQAISMVQKTAPQTIPVGFLSGEQLRGCCFVTPIALDSESGV